MARASYQNLSGISTGSSHRRKAKVKPTGVAKKLSKPKNTKRRYRLNLS